MDVENQTQPTDYWLNKFETISQLIYDVQMSRPGRVVHGCRMTKKSIKLILEAGEAERRLVRAILVARHVPGTKLNAIVNRIAIGEGI